MIKLFLSHVEEDSNFVRDFANFMEDGDEIRCWTYKRDTNFLTTNIPVSVSNEISNSDFMILFWSKNAKNKQIWIQREFAQGIDKETYLQNNGQHLPFVIVVRIDDSDLDDWLRGLRYITPSDIPKLKEALMKQPKIKWWERPITLVAKLKLLTISPNGTLGEADFIMRNADVRHLVVINEDNEIQGILSERDILEHIPPKFRFVDDRFPTDKYIELNYESFQTSIRVIMTKKTRLVFLTSMSTIKDAADIFIQPHGNGRISALPIIDDSRFPKGIVSYMDVMCHDMIVKPSSLVKDYCTPRNRLVSVLYTTTLANTRTLMEQFEVRHMPILDNDGYLIGMIDNNTVKWLSHHVINLGNEPVSQYMQSIASIPTTQLTTSISKVINEILCPDKNITALPVVEKEGQNYRLVGMFSYVDALKAIYGHSPNK